jgi:ferredoxin-NADP reductase
LCDAARHPNVHVVTALTRDPEAGSEFLKGRPDVAMLENFVGGSYERATFMTCGPDALMAMTSQLMLSRGVPPEHVKTESFFS